MRIRTVLFSIFIFTSLMAVGLLVALNSAKPQSVLYRAGTAIKTLANPEPPRNFLLPDMTVAPPREIYISQSGEKKLIRFSTAFINQGEGALELFGHADAEAGLTYAAQYVKERGGPGMYRDIGSFVFHPGHEHWHVEDYVFYQLIPFESREQTPITQTDKMSFCIWDEDSQNLDLENASPRRVYPFACSRQIQGMSVGWSDTYDASFEGQEMDITSVPDGRYIFRSIVDPENKILELSTDNNTSEVIIELEGSRLRVIE